MPSSIVNLLICMDVKHKRRIVIGNAIMQQKAATGQDRMFTGALDPAKTGKKPSTNGTRKLNISCMARDRQQAQVQVTTHR